MKHPGPLPAPAELPGRGGKHSQTRHSPATVNQSGGTLARGPQTALSGPAELPGRGMRNTRTRRSPDPDQDQD